MKNQILCDPIIFYNFVDSKRKIMDYPLVMRYENSEMSQDLEIANLFAKFFRKSYSTTSSDLYPYSIFFDPFITLSGLEIFSATVYSQVQLSPRS